MLYYYYYAITAGQNAGNCKKKKECKVCKKIHLGYLRSHKPTRLKKTEKDSQKIMSIMKYYSATLEMNSDVIIMCLKPVMVRYRVCLTRQLYSSKNCSGKFIN